MLVPDRTNERDEKAATAVGAKSSYMEETYKLDWPKMKILRRLRYEQPQAGAQPQWWCAAGDGLLAGGSSLSPALPPMTNCWCAGLGVSSATPRVPVRGREVLWRCAGLLRGRVSYLLNPPCSSSG